MSEWGSYKSLDYWDNLNSDVKQMIKSLPVNPMKLDKNLRNIISAASHKEKND